MSAPAAKCPLCDRDAPRLDVLRKEFLQQSFETYYSESVPPGVIRADYTKRRCCECDLEFFDPLLPGCEQFYAWIARHDNYYPASRQEWQRVGDAISTAGLSSASLLDVGCGDGSFMAFITAHTSVSAFGIDTDRTSTQAARDKGLTASCSTIGSFAEECLAQERKFSYITAFHCLEHVPAPLTFVSTMAKLLDVGGTLYVSIPYSPMVIENLWFDPLNHPPHHLTRWNRRSLEALAQLAGLSVRLHSCKSAPLLSRWRKALSARMYGPGRLAGKKRLLGFAAAHPVLALREIAFQSTRERLNGATVGDHILAELQAQ